MLKLREKIKMKKDEAITLDQALIMALKMHDRGHSGYISSIRTALKIRRDLNFIEEVGIGRKRFYEMLDEVQNEPIIKK